MKQQFELDWFKYIEYGRLIMSLIVLLLVFELFFRDYQEKFDLPMDEVTFDLMDEMTYKMDIYMTFCGIIAILLMAKNLRTLTT